MRGLSLLVTTILVALTLSGCIQGLLPQDRPSPAPEVAGSGWVELPMPSALPTSGLLGLWIPEGTLSLRMASLDPNATTPYFDPDAWSPTASRPDRPEPLLIVRGPDGHVLAAGDADGDLRATTGRTTGAMRADPAIFLDLQAPPPGLYAIALFGSHLPPRIMLELPPEAPLHPVLPLGIGYHRHLLTSAFAERIVTIDHTGSIAAPPYSVRADVDMRGYGLQGRVRLVNDTGAPIASHDAAISNRPGEDQNPIIFADTTLRNHESDPVAAAAGKWRWDAALTGTGHAFAWTGQSVDLPAPHPLPRPTAAESLIADTATLRVPLAGTIRPGEAAWFTMPNDARIRPVFASYDTFYENGHGFRVYDQDGRRIIWDLTPDDARAYPLPAGDMLIVNDGAQDLTVEILDTAPADAALHLASLDVVALTLGAPLVSVGYWEQSASVFLPGPVSGIIVTRYDDLFAELSVSVTGLDARAAANVPPVGFDGPVFPYYWSGLQAAQQDVAFTPWLDGGRYRVSASALDVASVAGLEIDIVTYALDGGRGPDGEPHPTPGP